MASDNGSVSLPRELCEEADVLVERRWRGYTSRAEIAKDGLRRIIAEAREAEA